MRPGDGTLLSGRLNHTHLIEPAGLQCDGQHVLHIIHRISVQIFHAFMQREKSPNSVERYIYNQPMLIR